MKTSYGTILVLAMMVVLLTAALPCGAAEKEEKSIWSEDKPGCGHKRFELTEEKIEHIMNRLKKTNPEEAEELEKLREEDPEKFKAELRKVMRERFGKKFREHRKERSERMKRHSERMGRHSERMKRHSERMKEHWGRYMKRCGGPGGPGSPGGPFGGGDWPRGMGLPGMRHGRYFEWLEENYTDEAEKLAELIEKDVDLYLKQLGLSLKKYGRIAEAATENPELAEVLKEDLELKKKRGRLLRRIGAASDDERGELVKELEEVIGSRFDLIVKRKQIEYEQMLKKLEKLKKRVEESESKVEKWKDAEFKKESVKARLGELVGETDEFRW
jgi:hypothetical protein